jgi:hypothetical protein
MSILTEITDKDIIGSNIRLTNLHTGIKHQTYASHYIQATPLITLSAQTCILPILILTEIGNREKVG